MELEEVLVKPRSYYVDIGMCIRRLTYPRSEYLNYSMGGLLAADTFLEMANTRPDPDAPLWPRIIACLAFDTRTFFASLVVSFNQTILTVPWDPSFRIPQWRYESNRLRTNSTRHSGGRRRPGHVRRVCLWKEDDCSKWRRTYTNRQGERSRGKRFDDFSTSGPTARAPRTILRSCQWNIDIQDGMGKMGSRGIWCGGGYFSWGSGGGGVL